MKRRHMERLKRKFLFSLLVGLAAVGVTDSAKALSIDCGYCGAPSTPTYYGSPGDSATYTFDVTGGSLDLYGWLSDPSYYFIVDATNTDDATHDFVADINFPSGNAAFGLGHWTVTVTLEDPPCSGPVCAGATEFAPFGSPPPNNPLGVPGPIAGAGLPGLMFAGAALLGWWRKRRAKAGSVTLAAA